MADTTKTTPQNVAHELAELGCDLQRPAIAYVASASGSQPATDIAFADDLVPGLSPTGFGSAECALAIARDGTIFTSPAYSGAGVGVLRSVDNGSSWEQLIPEFDGRGHNRDQTFLYMDPVTERLFFHSSLMEVSPPNFKRGFDLTYSDDHGETWHHVQLARGARDWLKIFSGPRVSPEPTGCQSVIYASAPSPISTRFWPLIFPRNHTVNRSLDGGATWERMGSFNTDPRKAPGMSRREWILFGNGLVGPDGTLFIGGRFGRSLGVATSRDEGASWTVIEVPRARLIRYFNIFQVGWLDGNYVIPEPLAIDSAGNLFASWPDEQGLLRLAVSRDQGATWSKPVVASAPGIRRITCASITAHQSDPARLAFAYYGTTDGRAYHGYIAETADALAAEPVFRTQAVDPPGDALYPRRFRPGYIAMWFGGDLMEYVQVRYAPDGTILASFCKRMAWRSGWRPRDHAGSRLQGMLGRLVSVPKSGGPRAPTRAAP